MMESSSETSDPTKWDRPDWRKEEEYPNYEVTTFTQWKWEFLRRNPEYCRLWSERFRDSYAQLMRHSYDPEFPGKYNKDRLPTSDEEYEIEIAEDLAHWEFEYQLAWPPDPRVQNPEGLVFLPSHYEMPAPRSPRRIGRIQSDYDALKRAFDSLTRHFNKNKFVFVFDYSAPFTTQVESAAKAFKTKQAALRKQQQSDINSAATESTIQRTRLPHKKDIAKYLRALDAREAGAGWTEIATKIFKTTSNQNRTAIGISYYDTATSLWKRLPPTKT